MVKLQLLLVVLQKDRLRLLVESIGVIGHRLLFHEEETIEDDEEVVLLLDGVDGDGRVHHQIHELLW